VDKTKENFKVVITEKINFLIFKALFLVGGLGSNLYLSKFLQTKLGSVIQVKQPETGY